MPKKSNGKRLKSLLAKSKIYTVTTLGDKLDYPVKRQTLWNWITEKTVPSGKYAFQQRQQLNELFNGKLPLDNWFIKT